MVMEVTFQTLADVAALQKMACSVKEQVLLGTSDDSVQVDARSFLGLFTLDFSNPVKVTTDSLYVIRRLERASRAKAWA